MEPWNTRWKVQIRRGFHRNQIEIYFNLKGPNGDDPEYWMKCEPVQFRDEEDYRQVDEDRCGLRLPQEAAQQLMDELYAVGVRPTEGMGSAGSMAAAQEHLKSVEETKNRLLVLVEKAWEWGRGNV
jgi:hypothetical protein